MIYDELCNIGRYRGMSEWMDRAVDFLERTELSELETGRTEISGEKVFVNVMEAEARDESDGCFEIHRRYMDIQIDLEGAEGVAIGGKLAGERKAFDANTDFGTVECERAAFCTLGPGRFIVCMAGEPHQPGIAVSGERKLRKCVIKVAVE